MPNIKLNPAAFDFHGAFFPAVAAVLPLAIVFLLARVWPIWPRRFQGCDAYNILLNAACLRASRRLPIRVPPLFMLENAEQWYPPGFLLLCALVPEQWLERRYWLLNHLVDLGCALLLYASALWLGAGFTLTALAMLFYAISPGAVAEFASLNTRPLGLILANALLLTGFAAAQDPAWYAVVGLLCIALFYSHKLSVQLLWFTFPVLAVSMGEWRWLGIGASMYALSFLIWPRGAWRILRGHWTIVRFWDRNWPLLGAHAVRQSPIYGDGRTRRDVYALDGAAGVLALAKDALHQNYFVLPVLTALASGPMLSRPEFVFLLGWIGSAYLAGVLTHCVKPLRGIGLGRQYFKFAVFPSLLLSALALPVTQQSAFVVAAVVLAGALALRQYVLIARMLRSSSGGSVATEDADLHKVLEHIAEDDKARVMALPVHLCDLVAYRTRRPVYWGTHSDVFDERLEAFFPVLRHKLSHYVNDGVNRLLLDSRYASPEELELDASHSIFACGHYLLFSLPGSAGAGGGR